MKSNMEVIYMLSKNIKTLRKSKGLSQDELALKLNVVRQTISKWENGLSVPDSEMLISLSEVFETPVSILLGEDIAETEANDLKVISEKLEVLNLQLSKQKESKKNILCYLFILILVISFIILFTLFTINSPYLNWNYTHPETAFMGISFHIFEWAFIRLAPILIVGAALGIYLMRRNKSR